MTRFAVDDARAMLAGTPGIVRTLLLTVPPDLLNANEGPDTWSPREVLAHLTDLEEQDWIPRLTVILREGDARPLAPVDRVQFRSTLAERSVNELLDLFAQRRGSNTWESCSREPSPSHSMLSTLDFSTRGFR